MLNRLEIAFSGRAFTGFNRLSVAAAAVAAMHCIDSNVRQDSARWQSGNKYNTRTTRMLGRQILAAAPPR